MNIFRRVNDNPRCEQPSTRQATSEEHYTTCNTPLDASGDCENASSHVEL